MTTVSRRSKGCHCKFLFDMELAADTVSMRWQWRLGGEPC
jgi:hypothetical protein